MSACDSVFGHTWQETHIRKDLLFLKGILSRKILSNMSFLPCVIDIDVSESMGSLVSTVLMAMKLAYQAMAHFMLETLVRQLKG